MRRLGLEDQTDRRIESMLNVRARFVYGQVGLDYILLAFGVALAVTQYSSPSRCGNANLSDEAPTT